MTRQQIEDQIVQCEKQLKRYQGNLIDVNNELEVVEADMEVYQKNLKQFTDLIELEEAKAKSINESRGIKFVLSYKESLDPYLHGSKYYAVKKSLDDEKRRLESRQEELDDERKLIKRMINEYENQLAYLRRQRMYVTS